MRPITDRQRRVLDAVRQFIAAHGYPPTLRELGDALGIRSTNGVNDHLRALERKGAIKREPEKSRAITVLPTEAA